jgi:hypothetical protein
MKLEEPKIVPPRNDLKKVEVYAVSKALEISGKDPGCEYEYKSTDPNHPGYYGNYDHQHEIGDSSVGFATVEAWEPVSRKEVTQGRPRDDQGKPIDTAIRHGSLVLMKTTKENHAAYAEIDRLRDIQKSKYLRAGDKEQINGDNGGAATYTARAGVGFRGDHHDLLKQERGA